MRHEIRYLHTRDVLASSSKGTFKSLVEQNSSRLCHAYLRGAKLSGADLVWADLRQADLTLANLSGANLRLADMRHAELNRANLSGADLRGALFYRARLRTANFQKADLRNAVFHDADLSGADLRGAKLTDVDQFDGATVDYVQWPGTPIGRRIAALLHARTRILPEGDLIGYKKCLDLGDTKTVIVKLLIPKHAKRSHAHGRKCRASEAFVLDISGGRRHARSLRDSRFIYTKGHTVKPTDKFDDDGSEECRTGIHFYITRIEAENHEA